MAESPQAVPHDPCRFDGELTDAERKVVEAASAGTVADLWPDETPRDERSPDNKSDREDRTLRAEFLFCLLVGNQWPIHPRGIRIEGGYVADQLDLTGARIEHRVALRTCLFDQPILLEAATTRDLYLTGSHTHGIQADRLTVNGEMYLDNRFRSTGEIRLLGAHIGGQLSMAGAELANPDGNAFNADRAVIDDGVFMSPADGHRFTATGEIRLLGAHIGGQLSMNGAELANPDGNALSADGAVIDRGVFMSPADGHRFTATGEIRLLGAHIGGQLAMAGAELANPDGNAFNADRAVIDDGVFMSPADGHRFTATGEIRLLGAHIGGQLSMNGAELANPDGNALSADGAVIDRGVFMSPADGHRFTATGEIRLLGAHIGGELSMAGAELANPDGNAFNADRAVIDGSVFMSPADGHRFTATGQIRLLGAHIGGQLSTAGAELANPDGYALNADRAVIDGSVFMSPADGHRFTATGQIRLPGAHIGGQLAMDGAELANPDGYALNADRAVIDGAFFMRPKQVTGTVSLIEASTGTLVDKTDTWTLPTQLRLEGFAYRSLAPGTNRDPKHRVNTMAARSTPFSLQPYTHLAHTYRQTGDRAAARHVAWRMHWAEYKATLAGNRWRSGFPRARWWRKLTRRTIGHTVGFGYRFWRPLLFAVVLLLIGWGVFSWTARRDGFVPTDPAATAPPATAISSDCTDDYPCVQPFIYSLDVLLPVIDLHQDNYWTPDGTKGTGRAARWMSFAMALTGWVVIGLTALGLTERLRDPT